MDKKYIPSALVLYLNYFIHGIGCSILSQQVVKEMLASQWGLKDVMAVTSIAAALGLGRLISLPFAGPLSDKLGRRLSVIIGCASYVIFLVGIAFSPNTTIAYIAAVLGGIANSFLDTATYPAVTEIIYKYTGIATMGIKFFISVAQLLMPFFLGVVAGTSMSYLMLPVVAGVCIGIMGILAIFAPFPATSEAGKSESFISNLKNAHFSIESVALILIGFTSTATFQLWLNCAQTFGTEIAKIPSRERICYADILFCRYNGSIIRNKCTDHKIQTGKILSDLPSNLSCNVSISLHDQDTYDLLCWSIRDRICCSRWSTSDGNSRCK